MLKKKFFVTILALGVLGAVAAGLAREPSNTRVSTGPTHEVMPAAGGGQSLADKLDEFGQKLFGGIFPDDRRQKTDPPSRGTTSRRTTPRKSYRSQPSGSSSARRAGSVLGKSSQAGPTVTLGMPMRVASKPTPARHRKPVSEAPDEEKFSLPVKTEPAGLGAMSDPGLVPLHERLKTFRRSAFVEASPDRSNLPADRASDPPAVASQEKYQRKALRNPLVQTHERQEKASPETDDTVSSESSTEAEMTQPGVATAESIPVVTPTESSAATTRELLPVELDASISGQAVVAPTDEPRPTRAIRREATADSASSADQSVLITNKSPILGVETVGPRRITVGKESSYQVTIKNSGDVAADEVTVFVNLPNWADVQGAEASAGSTYLASPGEVGRPFRWKIGTLPSQGREKLVLNIVPRESRPFDLAVRWDYKPVVSGAMIEVQEPKLAMELEGPREVLFGESEVYKLRLSNTGTGDAENVIITLQPIGSADNQSISHNLGILAAGREKTIEVELTARQVGNLVIKVQARADGNARAELAESVVVRRAALQVDVQGPKVQYVGTAGKYRIRVHNPGTAPAKNVQLSVNIPAGAKYLSGIDGSRLGANGTKLLWTLENLDAAGERSFIINCSLGLPGSAQLEVVAAADGELNASARTTTRVEAMADLALDVEDPAGPVSVGTETTYEMRIRNRGTMNAKDVEVIAYFSRGIEPTEAEGGAHKLEPGRVLFSPISSIAAGEDLVLTIRARAETAGNHVFRAEVHCKPLGARLVSEETTHFYLDASAASPAQAVSSRPSTMPPADPVRSERQPPRTVADSEGSPAPGPLRRN